VRGYAIVFPGCEARQRGFLGARLGVGFPKGGNKGQKIGLQVYGIIPAP